MAQLIHGRVGYQHHGCRCDKCKQGIREYNSTPEQRLRNNDKYRKYRNSEKGKKKAQEYYKSGAYNRAQLKYRTSEKGKLAGKIRYNSEKGQKWIKEYRKSDKWRIAQKKYKESVDYPFLQHKRNVKSYGLSYEEYDNILKEQKGVCAVCGGTNNISGRRLCIDHDHETGRIRGLLCNNCNISIGCSKDNIYNLMSLVEYLLER